MFAIELDSPGMIKISGRLDAAQAPRAEDFLAGVHGVFAIDLAELEYVSSAGLGVFLQAHKRLTEQGSALRLTNVGAHIGDIFRYSGFDKLFTVETR